MTEEYMVKGSSIRSKLEFVRARFGAAAEAQIVEQIADRVGAGPILDASWYPFSVYDEVNRTIADTFFGGDVSQLTQAGAFSAEKALQTTYRAFAKAKDFAALMRRFAKLHQMFYDRGEIEVITPRPGSRSLRVIMSGAPIYTDADLYVACGFYTGAGRMIGLDTISCLFSKTANGADFNLRW